MAGAAPRPDEFRYRTDKTKKNVSNRIFPCPKAYVGTSLSVDLLCKSGASAARLLSGTLLVLFVVQR